MRENLYLQGKLLATQGLRRYLESSSVLATGQDPESVMDIMVLMPDRLFKASFLRQFGEYFVVDDHDHDPPVFTRFKSFSWLRHDFSRRLSVALWIFGNASVIQDPGGVFRKILAEQELIFRETLSGVIHQKYLEFRSERHNLRQAIPHQDKIAIGLIRSTVVKLALEIVLLSSGRPYPFKKWLSAEVGRTGDGGSTLVRLSEEFLGESDSKRTIDLSEEIVAFVIGALSGKFGLTPDFLEKWWLHLP